MYAAWDRSHAAIVQFMTGQKGRVCYSVFIIHFSALYLILVYINITEFIPLELVFSFIFPSV